MLKGDVNENGIKINRSNSQKKTIKQTNKQIARAAHFLSFFAVVLHNYNTVMYD